MHMHILFDQGKTPLFQDQKVCAYAYACIHGSNKIMFKSCSQSIGKNVSQIV